MSTDATNSLQKSDGNSKSIDKSLGSRLQAKRISSGLSPGQLAEKLQIHPEDVRAYEKGVKRINARRFLQLAKALDLQPTYFVGLSVEHELLAAEEGGRPLQGVAGVYLNLPDQGFRLNRAFVSVKNADLREAIISLVVELAQSKSAD